MTRQVHPKQKLNECCYNDNHAVRYVWLLLKSRAYIYMIRVTVHSISFQFTNGVRVTTYFRCRECTSEPASMRK